MLRAHVLQPPYALNWLPALLAASSTGRAQVIGEQITSALQHAEADSLVVITVEHHSSANAPSTCKLSQAHSVSSDVLAAAIVVHPPSRWPQRYLNAGIPRVRPSGQAASVLHAGVVRAAEGETDWDQVAKLLDQQLVQTMRQRGVRFLNWATERGASSPDAHRWPTRLGFERLADLDHFGISLTTDTGGGHASHSPSHSIIRLESLNWKKGWRSLQAYMELLERSLVGTLDCPKLTHYYSLDDIIAAYQNSPAFSPEFWFTIYSANDPDSTRPLGLVMLAMHGAPSPTTLPSSAATTTAVPVQGSLVAEMTYLGLLPEARGRGLGAMAFREVSAIAKQHHARAVVLAVDRQNHHAIRIYQEYGMQSLDTESEWIKVI